MADAGDVGTGAPVGRRRLLAGLGGASLAGVAASVHQAEPAAAAVSWTTFSPALKLREVQAAGVPAISGVTTTAQWAEDTNTGLVHIQFQCAFTTAYTTPASNGFWGFDDLTLHGLPAPKLPPTGVNNLMGGAVTAYPAGLAAFAPGGHELLVAGFSGNQVLFAHGSTAAGVTSCYLNRNSPYTWTHSPADPTSLAIVKGTVFYRKA